MKSNNSSVLIIDDEQMIVDQLSFFLSEFEYEITGLSDSKKALEYINKNAYDIVLTDLKMPDVSGLDIIKAVNEKGRDTEIVVMTGFATIDSAIEAIQYGVYDYVRKPFKFQEIKIILDRAAEKIYLKRENIALNNKIQQMLTNITMLYDISTILYQVSDFDMVVDMILDTLAEGMKIEKAGVFLCDESSGTFRIIKQRGLSDRFVDQFIFQVESKINDVKISSIETTTFFNIENGIIIDNNNLEWDNRLNQCVLAPIRYLGKLLGYMGIFKVEQDIFSREDEIKLLNIMTTQIAPIFQSEKQYGEKLLLTSDSYGRAFYNMISDKMMYAKRMQKSVTFASIRLVYSFESENFPSLEELKKSYKKIVEDEFDSTSEIIWQNFDSIFIIVFGGNPVTIELSCASVRTKIEELFTGEKGSPILSVRYVIMSYPLDANSAEDIINGLGSSLFNKLDKISSDMHRGKIK